VHFAVRRIRPGERGAALLEMAMVVPVFVVLLAGIVFFHRVLRRTQETMLEARAKAWERSMNGCDGEESVPHPERTSDMPGAPGAEVSTTARYGFATGASEDTVRVSVLAGGAAPVAEANGLHFETDVHAKVTVMCDTKPQAGNFPGVLRWILHDGQLFATIFSGAN
jgi:hypothetical protein